MLLGIPVNTSQWSSSKSIWAGPIFEETNLARSQLFVDGCNGKVAERHDLKIISWKKFKGVNGSGKHNNWLYRYG
jgi:glutamine synthetase